LTEASTASLDGLHEIFDGDEARLTNFACDVDVPEARLHEQILHDARIRQGERPKQLVSIRRQFLRERLRDNPGERCTMRRAPDAEGYATTGTEQAPRSPEGADPVGKEHQAKEADRGIKGSIAERERLSIGSNEAQPRL
jgi:hypothetical protein